MAIDTTYSCDRCGHEQKTQVGIINVKLEYKHSSNVYWSTGPLFEKDLCRSCAVALGFIKMGFKDKEEQKLVPQEPLSLEEMIRELIRDEIQASQ